MHPSPSQLNSWCQSGWHHPCPRSNNQLEPADGHTYWYGYCYMLFFNVRTKGPPLLWSPATIDVAKMTAVFSLMYASPAWGGFISAWDRKKIHVVAFLTMLKRRRDVLPPQSPEWCRQVGRLSTGAIVFRGSADYGSCTCRAWSTIHSRLPVKRHKIYMYDLRSKAHYYSLPSKDEQNFTTRVGLLHNNILGAYRWFLYM